MRFVAGRCRRCCCVLAASCDRRRRRHFYVRRRRRRQQRQRRRWLRAFDAPPSLAGRFVAAAGRFAMEIGAVSARSSSVLRLRARALAHARLLARIACHTIGVDVHSQFCRVYAAAARIF